MIPEQLNSDFKSVCKILFGSEIGELSEFEGYLKEMLFPYKVVKSSISGKEVFMSGPSYPEGARFVSQDEIGKARFEPVNVNEIKDIDSLLEAVSERTVFCGNKLFGTNEKVELGDNIMDSRNVYHSHNLQGAKYAAYCSYARYVEHVYGVSAPPRAAYSMRCSEGADLMRAFETYYSTNVADTYYVFHSSGCTNCMFCFNLNAKNHMIGNLQLTKERYSTLKAKLVSEMAERLGKDKRLFSITDIAKRGVKEKDLKDTILPPTGVPQIIDDAFAKTTKLVLDKEHKDSERFAPWLTRRGMHVSRVRGMHGTPTYKSDMHVLRELPSARLVTQKEALASASEHIEIGENESPGLEEIADRVSKKACFTIETVTGHSENVIDTPVILNATNCYRNFDSTDSMFAAYYAGGTGDCKYVFGGGVRLLYSQFCINCYDSNYLKTCFEVDGSNKCSGSYFCHNCEELQDSMFCFNAKGLKYAIGNTEVGRTEFLRVKKILLDYVNKELEAKNGLEMSVFSLGERRKRR